MMEFDRETYKQLFRLGIDRAWLAEPEHEVALNSLIDSCKVADEVQLIVQMLSRFEYLRTTEFRIHLESIVSTAFEQWGFPDRATQIVASHPSNDPDSSQFVMHMLKPILRSKNLVNLKLKNRLHDAVKDCIEYPNILVVDEFVGTGRTMVTRIDDLRSRVSNRCRDLNQPNQSRIAVGVVAAMEKGANLIRENGIQLSVQTQLSRGISDVYEGLELEKYTSAMLRLESELAEVVDDIELPSFGHGKAEALFATEAQNVPNSVFPIFWWPKDKNHKDRRTHFQRWES